jgi:hypothetical protein
MSRSSANLSSSQLIGDHPTMRPSRRMARPGPLFARVTPIRDVLSRRQTLSTRADDGVAHSTADITSKSSITHLGGWFLFQRVGSYIIINNTSRLAATFHRSVSCPQAIQLSTTPFLAYRFDGNPEKSSTIHTASPWHRFPLRNLTTSLGFYAWLSSSTITTFASRIHSKSDNCRRLQQPADGSRSKPANGTRFRSVSTHLDLRPYRHTDASPNPEPLLFPAELTAFPTIPNTSNSQPMAQDTHTHT